MQYLNNFVKIAQSLPGLDQREIEGCTQAEINSLNKVYPKALKLPQALVEYLAFCGHGLSSWYPAPAVIYKYIFHYAADRKKLFLNEDFWSKFFTKSSGTKYPQDGLIIYDMEGYQFYFIRLSEGDNPPVYVFNDDINIEEFSLAAESYTEFLEKELTHFYNYRVKSLKNTPTKLQEGILQLKAYILDAISILEKLKSKPKSTIEWIIRNYNRVLGEIPSLLKGDYESHLMRASIYIENKKIIRTLNKQNNKDYLALLEKEKEASKLFKSLFKKELKKIL